LNFVSVVIVNWNGKKFIADCLDGLNKQIFKDFLIILLDNASDDGSLELVHKNYPAVKTIALSENLGFAVANNIAIKSMDNKYVALLNPDTVPHPDWLENLLKAMESHPEAGLAASKMLLHDRPNIIDRAGDIYTTAATALLNGRGEPPDNFNKMEWVFGACAGAALYRKSMLDDIGLFDEDFFLLYEDVDLSFRAQLRGYKCLYIPDAVVYHKASGSIGNDTPISVYYSHRNLEWVYIHNMPSSLIAKTILPHMIYVIAAFFFFVLKGRSAEFIKAKWHALKGLKKALAKRRHIQKNRKVSDDYIWSLFEKERLLPRLTRRISEIHRSDFKTPSNIA
jgi:GT2 family glycosyltransferase